MAEVADLLKGLFGIGATTFLQNDAIQATEQAGADALDLARTTAADIQDASSFTPFSVTSGNGVVDTLSTDGAFSGLGLNLTPELQDAVARFRDASLNAVDQADTDVFSDTQEMLSALGLGGPARSEQEIFDLLNQVQSAEQERERLALENRLFQQGRSGVRTSQFGGTPEELAIAKAREEARRTAAVDAFNLARQDEDRQFRNFSGLFGLNLQNRDVSGNLADLFLRDSFIPGDDLRRSATLGADIGSIDQQARTEGLRTSAGITESGLEAKLKADELGNQARIHRNQDLVNLLLGTTNEEGDLVGGLFDQIASFF